MQEMLHRKGDSRFVNKSHIFEAVTIAACNDICRFEIVKKIVTRVSGWQKVISGMNMTLLMLQVLAG